MTDSIETCILRLKPYYVFCTTSLALLILLLAILHPRTSLQIAESQLRVQIPEVSQGAIDANQLQNDIRQFLNDPSYQSQALVKVASKIRSAYGLTIQQNDEMLQIVAAHLDVQVQNQSENEQTVLIRFGHTSRSTALQVVSSLSEYFLKMFPQEGVSVAPAMDNQIADLKRRIGDLQQTRREYLEDRVDALESSYEQRIAEQSVPTDAARSIDTTFQSEFNHKTDPQLTSRPPSAHLPIGRAIDPSGDLLDDVDAYPEDAVREEGTGREVVVGRERVEQAFKAANSVAANTVVPTSRGPTSLEPPDFGATSIVHSLRTGGPRQTLELADLAAPNASIKAGAPPYPDVREVMDDPQDEDNLPVVMEPNPRWIEISDELAKWQSRLKEMLKTYTLKHPLANDAVLRIEDLQRQLANTPQFLESPSDQGQTVRPSHTEPQPSFSPVPELSEDRGSNRSTVERPNTSELSTAPTDSELRARVIESAEYSTMSAELDELQAQLAAAIHTQQTKTASSTFVEVHTESAPHEVGVLSKSISLFDLLSYLVPACVLGLGASIVRRAKKFPRRCVVLPTLKSRWASR